MALWCVDFLKSCLELRPELAQRIRLDPMQVLHRGRWRKVKECRLRADGLHLRVSERTWVRQPLGLDSAGVRSRFRRAFQQRLERLRPPLKVERLQSGTDRNRHHSAAFIRMVLRRGSRRIAAVAAYPAESREGEGRFLTEAVLWWHELRASGQAFSELRLYSPSDWGERLIDLFPLLKIPIVCLRYDQKALEGASKKPAFVRVYPSASSASRISSPYVLRPFCERVPPPLLELREENPDFDLVFRSRRWEFSFLGYPLAWQCSDGADDSVRFGMRGESPLALNSETLPRLGRLIEDARRLRSFPAPDPGCGLYRWGPERWLESLVLRDHRRIDRSFVEAVYCQVPTCLDENRKVVDILTATRNGRLAVVELKPEKDLGLVFQGLDYWDRVQRHLLRGEIQEAGYFPGMRMSTEAPLLYLVGPLFEFHRALPRMVRYLKGEVEIRCVGVGLNWRAGLKILSRFQL